MWIRHTGGLALAVSLLLVAGSSCASGGNPTPTAVPPGSDADEQVYTVQRGDVVRRVEFVARVAPMQEAELYFLTDGYLLQLLAQRGDQVQEGEVLAELEMTDLRRQLDSARLDLRQAEIESSRAVTRTLLSLEEAQLALDNGRASYDTSPIVLQAQQALTQSLEALAYAEIEYQKALDRPWEPQSVRDSYARQLANAQQAAVIAQGSYDMAVRERDFRLRQLEMALVRAQIDYEIALSGVDPRLEQSIRQLEERVVEGQLIAPFDGTVLSIGAVPGERVSAYEPVLLIGEPSQLELRAELTAEEMEELTEGQEVVLVTADHPGGEFSGTITRLPYGWGGEVGEADPAVHITPGAEFPEPQLGVLVRVTAVLEEKQNVLWLPPSALQTFRGRTFVIVQEEDGTQPRVDVVTGIESLERVEIVSGLEEGQVVVVSW
jgi:multidrug efflux pump subunit AcrA (membrane-fusion protein)